MPDFLSRYTDIVLAHQWENGLNYAYNDALYGGYPFVHNSTLLPKGVGYYYEGFDAFHGADVLLNVIDNHDKHHEELCEKSQWIFGFSITDKSKEYLFVWEGAETIILLVKLAKSLIKC